MEFKVGQKWRRRDGEVVRIANIDKHPIYPILADEEFYTELGTVFVGRNDSLDLVELVEDVEYTSEELDQIAKELSKGLNEISEVEERPLSQPTAKRFNEGKPDLSFLYPESERQEALVWMKGHEKYKERNNWKKLWGEDTVNVCCASALRHLMSILDGEMFDKESGCPHAAHVKANMTMLIKHMKDEGML